jgi:hypothetical protein
VQEQSCELNLISDIRFFNFHLFLDRVGIATGWTARFRFPAMQNFFLFSTAYRPALVTPQPSIQWVLGDIFPSVKRRDVNQTTHLQLVPRSRMVELYIRSPIRLHDWLHGAEPLRSRQLCSYSRTSQRFMEPDGSLPRSQDPSTGPYPEPDQSSPYHPILSKIHFNIMHPHTSWAS